MPLYTAPCIDVPCLETLWQNLRDQGLIMREKEPLLAPFLSEVLLDEDDFAGAIGASLCFLLSSQVMHTNQWHKLFTHTLRSSQDIVLSIACDMKAMVERDPACNTLLEAFLFFKGFHALCVYRVSHKLWEEGRRTLALYLQRATSAAFGVDIHPAAQVGCSLLLDHATSIVIGETAIVENGVSILHEVTLGGTGKEEGLRHPIVRSGVLIGAGAKILGRVEIGLCAKVGAGSVVLNDVPPHKTVVGIPAVIVGESKEATPSLDMEQSFSCCKESRGLWSIICQKIFGKK